LLSLITSIDKAEASGDMKREDKSGFWQEAIERQERSGLKVSAFCLKEGLKLRCFYYWRRKLRLLSSCGVNLCNPVSSPGGGFIEIASSGASSGVRVVIGERVILEIDRGFDPSTLTSAVYCLLRESVCSQ
jgi:hypothetical protein